MIKDYDELISGLNKKCKIIIDDNFLLKKCRVDEGRLLIYNNVGYKTAINRLDGGEDAQVSVYNWFGDYYLYVEVKFVFAPEIPKCKKKVTKILNQCSISISVFKLLSDTIVQLFRAEWDDYNEAQAYHPQPHWHITSDTSVANTFEEYAEEVGAEGFMNILNAEKDKIAPLKKFHFAMKGDWCEKNMTHSTPIESSTQVINWFAGLLNSIRAELEYIDKH